jgi:hypothetical protein
MNSAKLHYEKPGLQYWSADEFNAIEATMSGGGSSGTGFGFYYEWDEDPSVAEDISVNLAVLTARAVVGIVVAVATKNGALTRTVAGAVAERVANEIISAGVETVYYRSYEYLLRAFPYNQSMGVGYVCGQVVVTEYYEDRLRLVPISSPTAYTNISSELSYMESSCPAWELL